MTPKLILVILRGGSCDKQILNRLIDEHYRVTEFSSVGGFLRHKSFTLLLGVDDDQVEHILTLIRESCPTPPGAEQHTATVFVLDGEQFLTI